MAFVNYAHRGASEYAPENTEVSFDMGLAMQANGIETDIQRTKDGVLVLYHDDNLNRTLSREGSIRDYTLSELMDMDAGIWKSEKYRGTKLMLFEDFCKKYLPLPLTFALELKQLGIAEDVAEMIRKYRTHENIHISSFKFEALEEMHRADLSAKLSWLMKGDITQEKADRLKEIGGSEICPDAKSLTKAGVQVAKKNGLDIRLWGIGSEETMRYAVDSFASDITGMTCNFPDKLRAYLIEKGI